MTCTLFQTYPEWSSRKQILLSGFFWGYICSQILAGQLGKRFGIKFPLLCAILLSSLFTLLLPTIGAQFGYQGVLACRIMQGLTQGFIFPSIQALLGVWSPLSERTKYGSIVHAGIYYSFCYFTKYSVFARNVCDFYNIKMRLCRLVCSVCLNDSFLISNYSSECFLAENRIQF